ncbi:MAG: DUF502 domain-containing protein [Myxococcota bacterium]
MGAVRFEVSSEVRVSVSGSIRQSFLAGLLALLPLYITWKILAIVFNLVDGPLGGRINALISYLTGTELNIPGLGLLVTGLIVLAIGWLTRMVFFKNILAVIETGIERVPIVRSLYNASRQIVVPFTDKHALPFSEVVLVEYPMVGRHTLGLVAKRRITGDPDDPRVVVFFPSNHLHLGYPVVLHRDDLTPIDMSVEEAVKFFVSCGVIGDDKLIRSGGELIPIDSLAALSPPSVRAAR